MKKLLAFALTLLIGCASAPQPTPENCGPDLTQADIQGSVQTYIANINWKDPDSVQVRNIRVQPCSSHWKGLIAGGGYMVGREIVFEVNAKNSYGGYTGYQLKSIVRTPDGKVHWTPE